jgi:uncharacterized membrane protein YoaK (UPF0700 family)
MRVTLARRPRWTTQFTSDLAAFTVRRGEPDDLARVRRWAGATFPCVLGFVVGCAAGAVLELHFRLWALVLPVVLAVLAVPMGSCGPMAKTHTTL